MSKLSRLGWGFMALFFLASFLVGAVGFLLTSKSSNTTNQPPACNFSATQRAETLTPPTPEKIKGKVAALQTIDLQTGSGATAQAGSCVTVKYIGWVASTGKVFDQDFNQPYGLQFQLGIGYVIAGWDQGVVGMKVGGVRKLIIPAKQAYGSQSVAGIPANSDLVFVVKLLSVK